MSGQTKDKRGGIPASETGFRESCDNAVTYSSATPPRQLCYRRAGRVRDLFSVTRGRS